MCANNRSRFFDLIHLATLHLLNDNSNLDKKVMWQVQAILCSSKYYCITL